MSDLVDKEMEKKLKDPELKELYASLCAATSPSEMKESFKKFMEAKE